MPPFGNAACLLGKKGTMNKSQVVNSKQIGKRREGGQGTRRGVKASTAVLTALTMVLSMASVFVASMSDDFIPTAHAAVEPLPNPPLPGSCGQNVAIVVDLSGSMQPGNIDYSKTSLYALKQALYSYVGALKGTNTNIALFTFGTYAPNIDPDHPDATKNSNLGLTSVLTDTGAKAVTDAIFTWSGWGWTRWDLGLQQVDDSSKRDNIHYDYVLFITDGYPTDAAGTTVSDQTAITMDDVITAANNVKADKTRIIVIYAPSGTGADMNDDQRARIMAISGETHNQTNVLLNDYYDSAWAQVGKQLTDMATKCTSTVGMTATRIIHYVDANGKTMVPDEVQTISYAKSTDSVTHDVTYTPATPSYPKMTSPVIAGYTPDPLEVASAPVSVPAGQVDPDEVTVVYTPNAQRVVVQVVDDGTGSVIPAKDGAKVEWTGPTGTPVGFTETDARNTVPDGYAFVSMDNVDLFDNDDAAVQTITVHVRYVPAFSYLNSTWTVKAKTSVEGASAPYANGNSTGKDYWTATLTAKDQNDVAMTDLNIDAISVTVDQMDGVTISEPVKNDDGTYSVTISSTVASSPTATMSYDSRKVGGDKQISFVAGTVSDEYSTVTVDPSRQVAGSFVTITVTAKDENNNPVTGLKETDIVVTGASAGLPNLELSNFQEIGDGVYTYQATSKLVGDFEVQATVTGVDLTEKPHVTFYSGEVCKGNATPVNPDNITKFVMGDNDGVADGIHTDSATAYAYDCFGNAVEGASVTVDDITTNGLAGYLTPASYSVTTGPEGTVTMYWTSTKAGSFTAQGKIDGSYREGSFLDIRFGNGQGNATTSDLVVTPDPETDSPIVVGNFYTATVTVRDETGNNLVQGENVSFWLDPASPARLSADYCTTREDGTCEVTVTSDLATEVAIHATIRKIDLGGNGDEVKRSPQTVGFIADDVWVGPCAPEAGTNCTRVEVVADGAVANGEATDIARVYAYDRKGNPKKDIVVTSSTSDLALGTQAIAVTDENGTTEIRYTSTVAGAHTALVLIDSKVPQAVNYDQTTNSNGLITLNFNPGTASAKDSTLTINPTGSQQVNKVFTVTAHVVDGNKNPVSDAMVTFPPVANLTFNKTSCTSGADGTCTVTVTSRLVSTYTVSAKLGDDDLKNTVDAVFTAGPVCVVTPTTVCDPVNDNYSRVEVTTNGKKADGSEKDVATVYAYDYDGNPVKDVVVQSKPATGETALTVQPDVEKTNADGITTIWYTSIVMGEHKADVTIDGKTPETSPITVSFGSGDGDVDHSSWVVTPSGPLTVGTDTENMYIATATVNDKNDNPVENATVTFTISPSGNPVFTDGKNTCQTNESGECSVSVSSTVSGTYSMQAKITAGWITNAGTHEVSAPVVWKADAVCSQAEGCQTVNPLPDELRTRVQIVDNNKAADGIERDTVTVWAFDKWGNAVEGAQVQSVSQDGKMTVQTLIAPINTDGYSTIWYTSTVADDHIASVTVDGVKPVNAPVTVTFVSGDLDPANSTFVVYPTGSSPVVADGVQSWTGKLTAADKNGNPLPNLKVADMAFTVLPAGVTVSDVTKVGDGTYTVTYTSLKSGDFTATLMYKNTTKVGNDETISFVAGPVSDKYSTVTVDPDRQVAGSLVTVTMTARDVNNNPVLGLNASDIVVVGTAPDLPNLTVSNFTRLADGVYTYQATSKQVGLFTVTATVTDVPLKQNPTVEFYSGGVCVNGATPVIEGNVTRFDPVVRVSVANGQDQDSAKAYAYDCLGNPVKDAVVLVNDVTTGDLAEYLQPNQQSVKTGSDGTAMIYWKSAKAGIFTAEGTINGLRPTTGVMNWITFNSGLGDPAKSELVVIPDPNTAIVVGNSYTATVTVHDTSGNLVPNENVSFTLDPSSPATLSAASCKTDETGTCSVTVSSDLVTRVAIHATLPKNGSAQDLGGNGETVKASPQTVEFIAGDVCVVNCTPVDPTHVTRVVVTQDGAEANGAAIDIAQAFAYDRMGNPKKDVVVTSSPSDSTLTVKAIAKTGADGMTEIQYTSTDPGVHTAFVIIDQKVPTQAVSFDKTVTTNGQIKLNFGSGTASAADSYLTIDPTTSQQVNKTFTVTAHVLDVNKHAVSGTVVSFPEVKDLTFDKSSCTSEADGTCQVTVTSRVAGTYTVSAQLNLRDLSNTVKPVFTAGPVCVVTPTEVCDPVNTDNYSRVEVTLNGQKADGLAHDIATVWAYDYDGNPVTGAVVQSAPVLSENNLTVQSNVDLTGDDGTTTIWYASTVTGGHKADVTIAGKVAKNSPITVSFGSGDGDLEHSSWVVTPKTQLPAPLTVGQDDQSTYTATATVHDKNNNPVKDAMVTFTITPSGSPVFTPEDSTCRTDEQGQCSVDVSSTVSGTYSMGALIAAGAMTNADTHNVSAPVAWKADAVCSQAEGCETVTPLPDELRTRVEIVDNNKTADGVARDTVTVWAFDKWGNAVEGALVQSVAQDAAMTVQTGISSIGKDGSSTIWYTSTVAGEHTASVLVDGVRPVNAPVTLTFVSGDLDPANSSFEVYRTDSSKPVVVADGVQSWTGTLTARDHADNLLSNLDVKNMAFSVAPEGVTVSSVDNKGTGVYEVTYTSTTSGPYTATLTYKNQPVGTGQPISFVAGAVSDANSTVTVSPAQQAAGSPVTITVVAKDGNNNPVLGLTAAQVAVVGRASGLPDLTITGFQPGADGEYTYQATSKLAGTFEVQATVTGTLLSQKPTVEFTAGGVCVNATPVIPGNVTRFDKVTTDQLANGTAKDSGKAYAYDCFGNPVEGASVVVVDRSTDDLAGFLTPATQTVTTGADGTAMVYWTSAKAGTYTAEGTIDGLRPEGAVMNWIRFTNGQADPSKSELVVSPVSPIQVENSYTATVTVRDGLGNLLKGATVSFSLDPGSPATLNEDSCTTGLDGTCHVDVSSDLVTTVAIHATLPKDGQAVDLGGNGDQVKASPKTVSFIAGDVWVGTCAPEAGTNCTRVEVVIDGAEANGGAMDVAKVYTYDRKGNAKAGVTVTSSTSEPSLGITSPVTTGADGTALIDYTSTVSGSHYAFVFIDSRVPAQAISSDGNRTDGRITLNFGSGTASAADSYLTIDPATSQVVNSTFTVTAHVRDLGKNPVSGAVVDFPAVDNLTFNQTSCVSGTDGTCEVSVTSRLAGVYTVSAKLGVRALPNTVNAQFIAGDVCVRPVQECNPVNPDNYTRVQVTRDGRPADGEARDIATAWAYDYDGNPVIGAIVSSAPVEGNTSLTVQNNVASTGLDGTTTIWYSSTVGGFHDADVTIDGKVPETSPIRMSFGAGNGDPDHSSWTVAPESPLTVGDGAESTYTVTATVKDAQNNPVEGAAVVVRIDPSAPVFTPANTCFTNAQGVCSVAVSSTKSGTYSLTAEIAGGPIKNADNGGFAASVAWRADSVCSQAEGCDPVDPELADELRTRVEITQDEQPADGSARDIVTVWAFDKWGNPAEGALVQSSGDSGMTVQTGIDAIGKNGSSTVWYTSMVAGRYSASVLVDGQTPVDSPVELTFVAGPVCVVEAGCEPVGPGTDPSHQTHVDVALNDQSTNGTDIVEVFAYDKTGNAVDGVEFEIRTDNDTLSFGEGGQTAVVVSGTQHSVTAMSLVGGHHFASALVGGVELTENGSPMDLRFLGAPTITGPKSGSVATEESLVITGTGQTPGDKIVVTDGENVVCETIVLNDLTWTCAGHLPDGTHILVAVETNDIGVDSPESNPVTVDVDATVPASPEVDPSNGTEVTGTTDPETTVTVTDKDGKPVEGCVDVVPDESGRFTCTPVTPIPPETVVNVTSTDPSGNTSKPTEIVIGKLAVDIAYATRVPGMEQIVTGTNFNPGEEVCLTSGGVKIGCATADKTGTVTFTYTVPEDATGTQTVVLTGSTSGEVTGSFLITEPGVPQITGPKEGAVTNEKPLTVTGTGEPGAKVTVTDGTDPVCEAVVGENGEWSCEVSLPDGKHTLTATSTDGNGNVSKPSEPVTITVDTVAPGAPEVDPSNGSTITGTVPGGTDPGTTVTVTDENGKPVVGCEKVAVDKSGHFSCTPTTPLPPKSTVSVTATDPAGNTSEPTEIVITALRVEFGYESRQPGQEQVVSGYNFNPGEEVCLSFNGTELGCETADENGTVTISFTVPTGTGSGAQTVTLTGKTSGSVSGAFTVSGIQVKTGGTSAAERPLRGLVAGLVIATAGVWVAIRTRKVTSRN